MANASTQLFVNAPLTINQNANTMGTYLEEGTNYDYIFRVNVASLCSGNMSLLFNNAAFSQNLSDIENVNINLVLDNSVTFPGWSNGFNNQPLITVNVAQSLIAFQTLQPDSYQSLGDRFLEIVAHKLFGHGQARAAINNDYEFFTHDAEVWDNLATAVLNTNFRHDIFNQYVALGRYSNEANSNADANPNNQNDVNGTAGAEAWVPFNFNGLTFDFPLYLAGNMVTDVTLTSDERNLIQNGPNVGGTRLVNGVYNIPVLVKFHQ